MGRLLRGTGHRCWRGGVLRELLEQLAEAAVAEALAVPKLMDRNGDIWWRSRDGRMIRLTAFGSNLACEWTEP